MGERKDRTMAKGKAKRIGTTKRTDVRIAIQVELNRAHGRALLEGVADYARECPEWRLELVEPGCLTNRAHAEKFDGIIARVMDDAMAEALLAAHRPTVDTYGRSDDNPLASIRLNDHAIAAMAFDCFREHHYSTFGYCGFPGVRFSNLRETAFREAVERAGSRCRCYAGPSSIDDKFFRNEKTDIPDAPFLEKWLVSIPKPIAIFCCNDLRALQVLNVCSKAGIGVPSEVAVLGVDNDALLCTFAKPSLSSIDTDSFALGRMAAEMLHRQLNEGFRGRKRSVPPVLHAPRRVVERASTDAYPFKTPWLNEAVRYIRANLVRGVTADKVVRHIGYSHPTVAKAFEDELGRSIKKEILHQRSRLACSLLRETRYSASEISARCGYRSPQYFSRCFYEMFGVTPNVWRQKRQFQKV